MSPTGAVWTISRRHAASEIIAILVAWIPLGTSAKLEQRFARLHSWVRQLQPDVSLACQAVPKNRESSGC